MDRWPLRKGEPPPVLDVNCLTLIGRRTVLVFAPPGTGKTTAVRELLTTRHSKRGPSLRAAAHLPPADDPSGSRQQWLLNSDIGWLTVVDGRLKLFRPEHEILVWLWDIARQTERRAISKTAYDRDQALPPERRWQLGILKSLEVDRDRELLSPNVEAVIDSVLIVRREARRTHLSTLSNATTPTALLALLDEMQSSCEIPSRFWQRSREETMMRAQAILRSTDSLPPVHKLGVSLSDSISAALCKALLEVGF